jgi:hypothetical protein
MTFTATIFTKLVTTHYVEILYNKYHPNQSRNTEITGRNSFVPLSKE